MFHEHDSVVLKKALPGALVPVPCAGAIVHVHDAVGQVYEVEFFDEHHRTLDVCPVIGDEYLELKTAYRDME